MQSPHCSQPKLGGLNPIPGFLERYTQFTMQFISSQKATSGKLGPFFGVINLVLFIDCKGCKGYYPRNLQCRCLKFSKMDPLKNLEEKKKGGGGKVVFRFFAKTVYWYPFNRQVWAVNWEPYKKIRKTGRYFSCSAQGTWICLYLFGISILHVIIMCQNLPMFLSRSIGQGSAT